MSLHNEHPMINVIMKKVSAAKPFTPSRRRVAAAFVNHECRINDVPDDQRESLLRQLGLEDA